MGANRPKANANLGRKRTSGFGRMERRTAIRGCAAWWEI